MLIFWLCKPISPLLKSSLLKSQEIIQQEGLLAELLNFVPPDFHLHVLESKTSRVSTSSHRC